MTKKCNTKCKILDYKIAFKDGVCPLLDLPKPRSSKSWYFEVKGEKLYPLCEDNDRRTKSKNYEVY
jgi:hypothetical protein